MVLHAKLPASSQTSHEGFHLQDEVRFVEFFGLPGAGKTTAAHCLARKLRERGAAATVNTELTGPERGFARRQLSRSSLILSQAAKPQFILACANTARLVASSRQDTLKDAVRVTWNLWAVAAGILRRRSTTAPICLLDQGLLQGVWSVMLTSRRPHPAKAWMQILSAVGTTDLVFVLLDAEPALARRRLLARGDNASRMQKERRKFDNDRWLAAARSIEAIRLELQTGAVAGQPVRLVCVSLGGAATPDEIADRILSRLAPKANGARNMS